MVIDHTDFDKNNQDQEYIGSQIKNTQEITPELGKSYTQPGGDNGKGAGGFKKLPA